ncbi:hypothetical protein PHMEG_00031675 [Phytophthora megakarya]|uniref:DDE Tnp4 domain-containing protein n=1 Tax=Phytophthora megakarya TaxID=4795 RepID=A0A225V006_9STRA|nr:hypothetical protein PHMEG_00031675 [Phytophthora megakarya]
MGLPREMPRFLMLHAFLTGPWYGRDVQEIFSSANSVYSAAAILISLCGTSQPFLVRVLENFSQQVSTGCEMQVLNCGHFNEARILVECVFDKLKAHCKVLYGVTDHKKHTTNARVIRVAAIIHNLLIDIGDKLFNVKRNAAQQRKDRRDSRHVLAAFDQR